MTSPNRPRPPERPRDSEVPLAARVKLRQLALATAIGETRNLRLAAQRLGTTQPAATRLLQDLEWALGTKLFERSPRGMSPTAEGAAALAHMTRALNDIDAIRAELDALGAGASGRVRVGVLGSIATLILPRSISRLKAGSPHTTVEITEGTHDVLVAGLRSGELDAVLGRTLTDVRAADLRFELLLEERFAVVTGVGQRGLRSRRGLATLVDAPWILPPQGVPARQRLDAAFLAAAGRVPRDVIESASILVNQQLLDEGGRYALMPEHVAAHYARRGLVARVACDLPDIYGPLALVTLRERRLLPAAAGFLDGLRQVVAELRLPASSAGIKRQPAPNSARSA